ncbi:hypothetical protein ACQPW1_29215 [Nocardia sp. CA-128927]
MREQVVPSPEAAHRVAVLSLDGVGTFELALADGDFTGPYVVG